jgi:nudix-type nucleoside diphosphatase (YffH/AdpP family)
MKVEILKKENLFTGFINLDRVSLCFEKFDGSMSEPVVRLHAHRGDAVAVLLYDSEKERVLLVRQFRYPMYAIDPATGWTLEVVAGSIEGSSSPIDTAIREVEEEAGFQIEPAQLQYIGKCYPSPGSTSERIYLYAVDVSKATRLHSGGGLEHETEDIEIVEMSYDEIFAKLGKEDIFDAKSLITLQWLQRKVENK